MAGNDIFALLSETFPNAKIFSFNSSTGLETGPQATPADTVQSVTDALDATALSSSHSSRCSKCGKTSSLMCARCKGLPAALANGTLMTWYCSKTCQIAHWSMHKTDCKSAEARQLLYRSASLTKALFYIHQETSFAWAYYKKIEKLGPWHVISLDQVKSETRKSLLVPFSTVTDLISDQREQEAFLTHLSCNEAIAKFGPMLISMLKGKVLSIEEVTVVPKDIKFEIVISQGTLSNGKPIVRKDGLHHVIFRVTLINKEQYAVDFSGAQYGHHQECLPWETYNTARVDRIIEIQAVGAAKQMLADNAKETGPPTSWTQALKIFFVKEVDLAVKYWTDHNGPIESLLVTPQDEYKKKSDSLLKEVRQLIELSKADQVRSGSWQRK